MTGKVEWKAGELIQTAKVTQAFDRGDKIYVECVWQFKQTYCINISKKFQIADWTEKNRSGKIKCVKLTKAGENIIITGQWIEIGWESEMTMNLSYKNS